jgi:hypothetical protein
VAHGIWLGPPPPPDDLAAAAEAGRAGNAAAWLADSPLGAALAKLGAAIAKRESGDRSESMGK